MPVTWLSLSTYWSLTSVQAALNVIISVFCTAGIWSWSHFWWERGCAKLMRGNSTIPLSALLTLSGPGESWDVVTVLGRRVFAKGNWRLLLQLVVIIAVTLACMLSGPIAKISLRSSRTVHERELEVLSAKGGTASANLLDANVLWNDTIQSLNQARFPTSQLLDYLPPSTAAWIYVAREWNPTWSMTCNYTAETALNNVTATGDYTFYDPVNAFPSYRDTYDPLWLNTSKYRMQADFTSWNNFQINQTTPPFIDAMFFIVIESDPEIDDRMYTNNDTMQISISVLHAQNFGGLNYEDSTESGATIWRPVGPVESASFTRVECNITRRLQVTDVSATPWVWTNDTYAITLGYQNYWAYNVENSNSKNLTTSTPTPEELIRFYQAYMATVSTIESFPTLRYVSIWVDTVQLSTVFLAIVIVLTSLTLYMTGRYVRFLSRHKSELREVYIPDSRLGWMIHAAKTAQNAEEKVIEGGRLKDRDYFCTASFGHGNADLENLDGGIRRPSIARVYTNRNSISGPSPTNFEGALLQHRHPQPQPQPQVPLLTIHTGLPPHSENQNGQRDEDNGHDPKQISKSMKTQTVPEPVVSDEKNSKSDSSDHGPVSEAKKFNPPISRQSSTG